VRYYILDDLVSPVSGRPLRAEAARVTERDGPQVGPCVRWCGLLGVPPSRATPLDCRKCSRLWLEQGALIDGEQRYPIVAGIPRFMPQAGGDVDGDTQESFGYEWEHFDTVLPDYDVEFDNYFGIVPRGLLQDAVVLDAGCGMGRWARQLAKQPLRRLYAVDFSRAIERAAATLADQPRAHCIQADICRLPFRGEVMSFSYCLGVLHHLDDPDAGMRSLARVTAGPLLVYLYYALDNRPRFHRLLLTLVTQARRLTSRLPKGAMLLLSWVIAALIYWPLARLARLLERCGLAAAAHQVPLSHYRDYSLRFMAGDAFDRFATPIEKRYTREQISAWLARYGRVAQFSERTPFWVSLGLPQQ
jgi:SAM-dependent methyltransferase